MLSNIISGVAQIGGAVAGSMIGAGAVNAANNMQARGYDAANQSARNALGAQAGLLNPYAQRGNAAGDSTNALLGLGGATYATPESAAASQAAEDAWAAQAIQTIRGQVKKGEARRSRQALEATAGQSPTQQLAAMRAVLGSRGVGILSSLEASRPLPGTQQASAAPAAPANPQAQQDAFQQFRDSTGYQFNRDEGLRAVAQNFAGNRAYQSGAAMKALQGRATGIADNTFGSYLQALQGQQQTGLQGAGVLSGAYGSYADRFGGNTTRQAENSANAAVAQGTIKSNALGQIAQGVGSMFGSSYGAGGGGGFNMGQALMGGNSLGNPRIPQAPIALPSGTWG
jgi:hypothetical protein